MTDHAGKEWEVLCSDCRGSFSRTSVRVWMSFSRDIPEDEAGVIVCDQCQLKGEHLLRIEKGLHVSMGSGVKALEYGTEIMFSISRDQYVEFVRESGSNPVGYLLGKFFCKKFNPPEAVVDALYELEDGPAMAYISLEIVDWEG